MLAWLMKNLVEEVPEQLSVCEFDCPNHECTINDWASCERREQALLQERMAIRLLAPAAYMDPRVFSPSSLPKTFPG